MTIRTTNIFSESLLEDPKSMDNFDYLMFVKEETNEWILHWISKYLSERVRINRVDK